MIVQLRGNWGAGKSELIEDVCGKLLGEDYEYEEMLHQGTLLGYRMDAEPHTLYTVAGDWDLNTVFRCARMWSQKGHVLFGSMEASCESERAIELSKLASYYTVWLTTPDDECEQRHMANCVDEGMEQVWMSRKSLITKHLSLYKDTGGLLDALNYDDASDLILRLLTGSKP